MKDNAFIRGDNPMTKMEIRGAIVDYLELDAGKNVLEIGAGTGSCSIQMVKTFPHIHLTCIEQTETGVELIKKNAAAHGVSGMTIHHGKAPIQLESGLKFDRVYMGGTGKAFKDIMTWLTNGHLTDGALLVFSTITLESLSEISGMLFDDERFSAIEGSQIAASRLETLGRYHYFKPLNPCTILKCVYNEPRKG